MNASKKNKQFLPPTGPYKVFVKDKGQWDRRNTARLQISVGNPKHDGDKFYALTEWAAQRYDHVIFIVSDTLQRHNIALNDKMSLNDSYIKSSMMGKEWLKNNTIAIKNVAAEQREITLWDDWLNHPEYQAAYKEIMTLFKTNMVFNKAIEAKATEFWERGLRQGNLQEQMQRSAAISTSMTYILEEVAAFAVMFKETPAVDIYPGEWFSDIFNVITEQSASELMSGFQSAECLRVDFSRNRAIPKEELALFSPEYAMGR